MVWLTVVLMFLLGAAPAAGVALGFHLLCPGKDIFDFFTKNMRGSFFAGFLTIGGFMLSLKTFVLVKMKEGLYDSKPYKDRNERLQRFGHSESLYTPLKRLSHLLFSSILAALLTSALQLTLGLVPRWWSAMVCAGFAGGTIVMLVFSLLQIKANLDEWFRSLDEAHEAERTEQRKQNVSP